MKSQRTSVITLVLVLLTSLVSFGNSAKFLSESRELEIRVYGKWQGKVSDATVTIEEEGRKPRNIAYDQARGYFTMQVYSQSVIVNVRSKGYKTLSTTVTVPMNKVKKLQVVLGERSDETYYSPAFGYDVPYQNYQRLLYVSLTKEGLDHPDEVELLLRDLGLTRDSKMQVQLGEEEFETVAHYNSRSHLKSKRHAGFIIESSKKHKRSGDVINSLRGSELISEVGHIVELDEASVIAFNNVIEVRIKKTITLEQFQSLLDKYELSLVAKDLVLTGLMVVELEQGVAGDQVCKIVKALHDNPDIMYVNHRKIGITPRGL
jgi:hypothetical protein